jgi:hypothetical protein
VVWRVEGGGEGAEVMGWLEERSNKAEVASEPEDSTPILAIRNEGKQVEAEVDLKAIDRMGAHCLCIRSKTWRMSCGVRDER